MADEIQTPETDAGVLADFDFDTDQEFFNIKPGTLNSESVMKQVQKAQAGDDLDTIDDDDTSTNLDTEPKNTSKGDDEPITTKVNKPAAKKPEATSATNKNKPKETQETVEEEPEFKFEEGSNQEPANKDEKNASAKGDTTQEDTNISEEEKAEKESNEFYTALANDLMAEGVLTTADIKEGDVITKDKFIELQREEIEAGIDETFQAFFDELDDEAKDFLAWKKNGGNTHTFLAQYGKTLDLSDFDSENPQHIDRVIDHYLNTYERLDPEDLADRKKYIKDSGKEKAYATRYFNTIQKDDIDRKKAMAKAQEQAALAKQEARDSFNDSIRELVVATDKVGIFPITKVDHKDLAPYMTKPTVKVNGNRYIPELQRDLTRILAGKTEEDRKELIILAKIIKNKFNLPDLVTETTTKVARKTKSKLEQAKDNVQAKGSGYRKRSIADYFQTTEE